MRDGIIILISGILISAMSASAAIIVVDKAGGGDYTTITAGYRAASPGDIVLVKDGRYDEHVSVGSANSGTEGNPVTIRAENRHGARVIRFLVSGNYVTIDGFEIANSPGHGIGNTGASNVSVINNYVHDCVDYGIQGGKSGYVAHNIIERTKSGIWVDEHSLVEYNRLLGLVENTEWQVQAYFKGDSVTIRNNFMWNPSRIGDFTRTHEVAADFLFENNFCVNAKHGSESEPTDKGDQIRFTYRNNIFINTMCNTMWIKAGIRQMRIVNNTFVNGGTYTVMLQNLYEPGNTVMNNIMYYYDDGPDSMIYCGKGSPAGCINGPGVYPPETDYNLWYGTGHAYANTAPGDPLNENGMNADPLFEKVPVPGSDAYYFTSLADTAEWDLHLQSGSPAIDAGTDLGLVADFAGNGRKNGSAVDLGALEYHTTGIAGMVMPSHGAAQYLVLSPLPVTGHGLTVRGRTPLGLVQVYDHTGKHVWQAVADGVLLTVPRAAFTAGAGQYVLITGKGQAVRKFTVIE